MIAKITKGKGFRGLAEYLVQTPEGEQRGQVLATNLSGTTPRQWAQEFSLVRRLRPTLGKAVFHASLSPSPDDPPLSDEDYGRIARHFMNGMGFPEDAPFVVIRHDDQSHPHIHIAASRITPTGEVVSDARDYQRAENIIREIEAGLGLRTVESSAIQKNNKRKTRRHNAMADQHDEHNEMEIGEKWDEERRREARRQTLEDDYRDDLRRLFDGELAFIRRSRTKGRIQIRFKDGGTIYDEGDRMRIINMTDHDAARRMIVMALAKNWTAMSVSGNTEFVKACMRLAMQNGISVAPKDAEQAAILDEVVKERTSMGGEASPPPATNSVAAPAAGPKPSPINLTAFRQARDKATPKRNTPRIGRR